MRTSPEEFVKVWQTSSSVTEVADKIKMSRFAVYARAKLYRKQGVPLKSFNRIGSDWKALKQLAESLNGGPHEE